MMYSKWVNDELCVFDKCMCGEYHEVDCDYLSSPKVGQYDAEYGNLVISGVTFCDKDPEWDDHKHWDMDKKDFDEMLNSPINLPNLKTIRKL